MSTIRRTIFGKKRKKPRPQKKRKQTPELCSYYSARKRCRIPTHANYDNYGGRGIEFRFESFEQFLAELGPKPSRKHSLDRFPNNDGHYEPGNVRWATMQMQANNRRTNRKILFRGQLLNIIQVAKEMGLSPVLLYGRKARGWCDFCTAHVAKFGGSCGHRSDFQPSGRHPFAFKYL